VTVILENTIVFLNYCIFNSTLHKLSTDYLGLCLKKNVGILINNYIDYKLKKN